MTRIAFIMLLVLPAVAAAGVSGAASYAVASPDGTRVLVMVHPHSANDRTPTITLPDGRVINVHDNGLRSGAYDAATLAPLWQIDWFAFERDLVWTDDFRHVARMNIRGTRSDWAIAFYDQGQLVRSYDCAQLLAGLDHELLMPFRSWDWHTQWYGDFGRSVDGASVQLSTVRRRLPFNGHELDLGWQEFYTFDLASGSILTQRRVGGGRVAIVILSGTALLLVPPLALRMIWRRIRARRYGRGFPLGTTAGLSARAPAPRGSA